MNRVASIALLPFSALYGATMKIRLALYQAGLFGARQLEAPVISVGNITTGGTGKTPLVEWIARELADAGRRPCILTRGYARANEKDRVIVADGRTILANADQAGDEAVLLAEQLKGRAVVIADRDRAAAAQWAIENLRSDCFVLDDGFQNLRLTRDLNIVTIDATNPWSNGHLLPAGLLREPRSGLRRADCIVITRSDQSPPVDALRREIDLFSGSRPIFVSRMKGCAPQHLTGSPKQHHEDETRPAAAFCGIGNPQSFFAQLRAEKYRLTYVHRFADHHKYTQNDIDTVVRAATANGAHVLLTTAKDEVKLRSMRIDLPCYVFDIQIEIDDEARLRQLIMNAIDGD